MLAAAPRGARNALTSTVESRTMLGMIATEVFHHLGNVFFLLLRRLPWLGSGIRDLAHGLEDTLPGVLALNDRHRLEQDAALDGFGFKIGTFFQRKPLPQFSGQRNLSGTPDLDQ